ncbi:hypothetical protein Ancab_038147 [Ancistrocladus abbreviatus]
MMTLTGERVSVSTVGLICDKLFYLFMVEEHEWPRNKAIASEREVRQREKAAREVCLKEAKINAVEIRQKELEAMEAHLKKAVGKGGPLLKVPEDESEERDASNARPKE